MTQIKSHLTSSGWSRRTWIKGVATWTGMTLLSAPWPGVGQEKEPIVTPVQGDGPFYPIRPEVEQDADLVRVTGMDALAQGTVLHLGGRVLDRNGQPVKDASVEIWQCDANGIYRHPNDRKTGRDPGFQGFGTCQVDGEGHYAFRTIRPVGYSGRAAHIHFKVKRSGQAVLSTQMYDGANAERNGRDFLYRGLTQKEREAVTVTFGQADAIEAKSLQGRFDLVLA